MTDYDAKRERWRDAVYKAIESRCPWCHGEGTVLMLADYSGESFVRVACHACEGTGRRADDE